MKKLFLSLMLVVAAAPLWAQTTATTGPADFSAERARLDQERKSSDERFAAEQAACYQKFAVQGCLDDSRRSHREATENIKRQEAAMNDIERKRRGAAALDRLEEKANPRAQDTAAEQERSLKSQQEREQRAADHAQDRARIASEAAEKQRQLEEKQRAHAEEQAKAASRRAEAPANREAHERKLEQAEQHRRDRARRNAENTKPRSAPLPTPP